MSLNPWSAAVESKLYDPDKNEIITEYHILTDVKTFAEVMEKMETYYGSSLCSCNITLLDDTFFEIDEKLYKSTIKKELYPDN